MPQNKYEIPNLDLKPDDELLLDAVINHPVPDERKYKISFEKYKKRDCEICLIDKTGHLQKTLEWIRDVGLSTSPDGIKSNDTIDNRGNYAFLYNSLDDGAVVKEFKCGGTRRIFFYVDEGEKVVNCLLIKNSHIEY